MNKLLTLALIALLIIAITTAATIPLSTYTATDPTAKLRSIEFDASNTILALKSGPDTYLSATTAIDLPEARVIFTEAFYLEWQSAALAYANDGSSTQTEPVVTFTIIHSGTGGTSPLNAATTITIKFADVSLEDPLTPLYTLSPALVAFDQTADFDATFPSNSLFYTIALSITAQYTSNINVSSALISGQFDIFTGVHFSTGPTITIPPLESSITTDSLTSVKTHYVDLGNDNTFRKSLNIQAQFGSTYTDTFRNDTAVDLDDRAFLALQCTYSGSAGATDATEFFELTQTPAGTIPRGAKFDETSPVIYQAIPITIPASFSIGHAANVVDYTVSISCVPLRATYASISALSDITNRMAAYTAVVTPPATFMIQTTLTFRNPTYQVISHTIPSTLYVNLGTTTEASITIQTHRSLSALAPSGPISNESDRFQVFYVIGPYSGNVRVTTAITTGSDVIADALANEVVYTFIIPALQGDVATKLSLADVSQAVTSFVIQTATATTSIDIPSPGVSVAPKTDLNNALLLSPVTFAATTIMTTPIQWGSTIQTLTGTFTKTTDVAVDMSKYAFRFKLTPDPQTPASFAYHIVKLPSLAADNTSPSTIEADFSWNMANSNWKLDLLDPVASKYFSAKPATATTQADFTTSHLLMVNAVFSVDVVELNTDGSVLTTRVVNTIDTTTIDGKNITPKVYTVVLSDATCIPNPDSTLICGVYTGTNSAPQKCEIATATTSGAAPTFAVVTDADCTANINMTPVSGVITYCGGELGKSPCSGHGTCTDSQCECAANFFSQDTDEDTKPCYYPVPGTDNVQPIIITAVTLSPTKITTTTPLALFTTVSTKTSDGYDIHSVERGALESLDQDEAYLWEVTAKINTTWYDINSDITFTLFFGTLTGTPATNVPYGSATITFTKEEASAAYDPESQLYKFSSTTAHLLTLSTSTTVVSTAALIPTFSVTNAPHPPVTYTAGSGAAGSLTSLTKLKTTSYIWQETSVCSSNWCGIQGVTSSTFVCKKRVGGGSTSTISSAMTSEYQKCTTLVPDKSNAAPSTPSQQCTLTSNNVRVCLNGGTCTIGEFVQASESTPAHMTNSCACGSYVGTFCETNPSCDSVVCSGNGILWDSTHSVCLPQCLCNAFYKTSPADSAMQCNICVLDDQTTSPCSPYGTMTDDNGNFEAVGTCEKCKCINGGTDGNDDFSGSSCHCHNVFFTLVLSNIPSFFTAASTSTIPSYSTSFAFTQQNNYVHSTIKSAVLSSLGISTSVAANFFSIARWNVMKAPQKTQIPQDVLYLRIVFKINTCAYKANIDTALAAAPYDAKVTLKSYISLFTITYDKIASLIKDFSGSTSSALNTIPQDTTYGKFSVIVPTTDKNLSIYDPICRSIKTSSLARAALIDSANTGGVKAAIDAVICPVATVLDPLATDSKEVVPFSSWVDPLNIVTNGKGGQTTTDPETEEGNAAMAGSVMVAIMAIIACAITLF